MRFYIRAVTQKYRITELTEIRDGSLEKLWGAGNVQKKNSCKGKLSEKKFMHAE